MTAGTCCEKRQLRGDLSGKEMKDGDRNIVLKVLLAWGKFLFPVKKKKA